MFSSAATCTIIPHNSPTVIEVRNECKAKIYSENNLQNLPMVNHKHNFKTVSMVCVCNLPSFLIDLIESVSNKLSSAILYYKHLESNGMNVSTTKTEKFRFIIKFVLLHIKNVSWLIYVTDVGHIQGWLYIYSERWDFRLEYLFVLIFAGKELEHTTGTRFLLNIWKMFVIKVTNKKRCFNENPRHWRARVNVNHFADSHIWICSRVSKKIIRQKLFPLLVT